MKVSSLRRLIWKRIGFHRRIIRRGVQPEQEIQAAEGCPEIVLLGGSSDGPGSPPESAVSHENDCEAIYLLGLVRAAVATPTKSAGRRRFEPP